MEGYQGVKFVLMVNKQGHTRFSKWMQHVEDDPHRRRMMEYELVRKCMPRDVDHANFIQYRDFTVVYRRYASLFFMVGVDNDQAGNPFTGRVVTQPCCSAPVVSMPAACHTDQGESAMQSPMMIWEMIHRLVEMLNRTFENVSELDIMINSGLAHLVLDEILGSGFVMDTSQSSVTAPLSKLPVQATRSSNLKP